MRKLIGAGTALAALFAVSTASAADIPARPYYKAPPPIALYNWSGWYGGIDAGYLGSQADQFVDIFGGRTAPADPDGFVGGFHLGYRWQAPGSRWVWGIEGDIWGSTAEREVLYQGFVTTTAILNIEWGASVRGIAGFTLQPRTLLYATGGVAFARIDGCTNVGGPPATCFPGTEFKDDRVGWTVGIGLAHAFTDRIITRIEYLYADYGDETYATPALVGGITNVDLQTHVVRGGLSWRF